MPKRRHEAEDLEYYRRKIKKLEDQQKCKRRRILIQSSSDSDENTSSDSEPAPAANCGLADATPDAETEAGGGGAVLSGAALIPAMESAPSGADIDDDPYPELDPDLLGALGEETGNVPKFGEKIHRSLAQRWDPILKNGLSKETKDKLLKEYLVPENCTLLQAPKLNREVSAAISEASRHRDKRKETEQQQLGVGISAINKALTLMLTGDDKVEAIRIISDGCRILTDLHYQETQARRSVINYALAKPFLNIVQDGERDDTLYGTKLGEKIKASKTIEKQGLSIKKFVKQTKTTSVTEQAPSSSRPPARPTGAYQGNWAGPSRFQQNRGGRRGSGRTYAPATSRRAPSSHHSAAGVTGPNKPRQSATRH